MITAKKPGNPATQEKSWLGSIFFPRTAAVV
jgi:hypothetical protein